jgi:DNA mismatch repair ATPase MutS
MKSRVIALILILAHIACYLPAQDISSSGVQRGMARLERYLDRAAAERSYLGWEQVAAAGLESALLEMNK